MKHKYKNVFFGPVSRFMIVPLIGFLFSCRNSDVRIAEPRTPGENDSLVTALLLLPENPEPGKQIRIVAACEINLEGAKIKITGPSESEKLEADQSGCGFPSWKIFSFQGFPAGNYHAALSLKNNIISELDFEIGNEQRLNKSRFIWETLGVWDPSMELLWSAWINSLFSGCTEQSAWPSLHKITQDSSHNFLYNFLSLDEDDPGNEIGVIMKPDCADNPFFLRAYFAWKLKLPFGYHLSDRGSLNRAPGTGKWITNQSEIQGSNPVLIFNSFLRKVMDGVHSGTARTELENENSDYYPVPLESDAIRPGTVYADPYGHTLVVVRREPQTKDKPGLLLAVDAQPDGTIGIRRFWKGNFLFNTTGVIGEPGFKAFRPVLVSEGSLEAINNERLTRSSGFVPFSLQQKKLGMDDFYNEMDKIINPEPLDPEEKLSDLINSLHEQLLVRVISVSNGEEFMKSHPGTIIDMPNTAEGIFQTGGLWESYSTPNRDLRLLIAMDAVLAYPGSLLEKKADELEISYTRTDGSLQKLTVSDILKRREAFEMAYNPNDGIEIRWGAPEGSVERSTCRRKAAACQNQKMRVFRKWFSARLHPPT